MGDISPSGSLFGQIASEGALSAMSLTLFNADFGTPDLTPILDKVWHTCSEM